VARHDLVSSLANANHLVDAADHAVDAAAVTKSIFDSARTLRCRGGQHVGVGKIDGGVAIGVNVSGMPELGRAPLAAAPSWCP